MTLQTIDTDIAIVGAGPTGLMLANLLGMQGINTTVFERREAPFTEPRAIAFDPETLRLFQTIGCYDHLADTLQLDVPVHYLNANGKTLAHIYDCPPAFGHSGRGTYYQPELEQALLMGLETRNSVSLKRGVEVMKVQNSEDSVRLEVQASDGGPANVRAKFVVDCSGGASQIRKQVGIGFTGTTYREKWLVIDVQGDDYEGSEIKFFCDPRRPAVTLPVSKNRRRWEFLVMPGDDETKLACEKSARALMATYGAGNATKIERSLVYAFHARFADRFREGRVLLAGDSAHVMPPFAGQGLNSGMRDAANLAWKLAGVVSGQFNDTILDTYDPERRPHVEDMTKLTIKLGRSIMPTNSIRAWLRDRMMITAWRFASTREKLNRGDMIPKPSIDGSSLVNWKRRGLAGKMIEQPILLCQGKETKLDEMLGAGFSVLGVNCRPEDVLNQEDVDLLRHLNATTISVSTQQRQPADAFDSLGSLKNIAGGEQAILIVRPDRFIADVFEPRSQEKMLTWMEAAYGFQNEKAMASAA
ncbi:MAG: bifunctional 3-(3-hydroxy-phenyl)propionate/3-hydroxycinnamic acid hydroxylase [Pseudomonadota bacterium]